MSEQDWKTFFEDPRNTPFIIEQLKEPNNRYLQIVCLLYRSDFIRQGQYLVSKLDKVDFEDAFHDAFIVLLKNLDKFKPERCIKDYLFVIFKRRLFKIYNANKRIQYLSEFEEAIFNEWDEKIYNLINHEYWKHLFQTALPLLGEKCKTLLTLSFYRGFADDAIADTMGYKDESVVYAKKWTCLQRLKDIVNDKR